MAKYGLKVSEVVARDIARSIAETQSSPGEMLESEADMLSTFGVSRGTLREALRLLESQGLVQLKPGPRGGPVIGRPEPLFLGKTISLFLRMMGATYGDLCDCIGMLSPLATELAARHCDPEKAQAALAAWAGTSETTSDHESETESESDFHSVVNHLSGNRILALVVDALESLFMEHMLAITSDRSSLIAQRDSSREPARATVHTEHGDIARCIIAKQPRKARVLMQEHWQDVFAFGREQLPAMMNQPVEWL